MQHIILSTSMSSTGDVWALALLFDSNALGLVPGLGLGVPGSQADAGHIAATLFDDEHVKVSVVVQAQSVHYLEYAKAIVSQVYLTIPQEDRRKNVEFFAQVIDNPNEYFVCPPPPLGIELTEFSHAVSFQPYVHGSTFIIGPTTFVLLSTSICAMRVGAVTCNMKSIAMTKVQANMTMLHHSTGEAKEILSGGINADNVFIGYDGPLNAVILTYDAMLAGNPDTIVGVKKWMTQAEIAQAELVEIVQAAMIGHEDDIFSQEIVNTDKEAQLVRMEKYQTKLKDWFDKVKVHPGSPKKLRKTAPVNPTWAPARLFPAFEEVADRYEDSMLPHAEW